MTHFIRLWILLAFLLGTVSSHAQQAAPPLVSGKFSGLPFEQFAQALEAQTHTRLFFDPAAVDSLVVTLQVQAQPLPAVLAQALQGRSLHFAADSAYRRIFITAGPAIEPGLSEFFFEPKSGHLAAAEEPAAGPTANPRSRTRSGKKARI